MKKHVIDFTLRDHNGMAIAGGAGYTSKRKAMKSAKEYCRDMLPESSLLVLNIDGMKQYFNVASNGKLTEIIVKK